MHLVIASPLDRFVDLAPMGTRSKGRRQRDTAAAQESDAVLILGRNRELTLYRQAYLQDHGFRVLAPADKAETLEILAAGGFGAAVISYTLSSESVMEYMEILRQEHPECSVVIVSNSGKDDPHVKPDLVIRAEDGPGALLSAVRKVTRKRSQ